MLDPARLVFIDETATSTNMVRVRGRCARGERLVASVPHGHWKTITFLAGLRHDGIVAPFVIDGAMNGPAFLAKLSNASRQASVAAILSSWTISQLIKWPAW